MGARPALWRLPLLAFLIAAVVCLRYLDSQLGGDYRRGAADLAAQGEGLIERELELHATLLHALARLSAEAPTAAHRRARLQAFARAALDTRPELLKVYALDERGAVAGMFPVGGAPGELIAENHLLLSETAEAVVRAGRGKARAATRVFPLRPDTLGFVLYEPVLSRGSVTGFVAAAIASAPLLRSWLHPLEERIAYRVTDGDGTVLAESTNYPRRAAERVTRDIALAGAQPWTLEVPIGWFQPRGARLLLWGVGAALLLAVCLLVLREEARAARIAMHSFNLELLSRDLLDANVRLEERSEQLAEANRAKSRFLANVSHELRTPLNAIVGYNALALSGLYGEPSAELRAAHDRIRAAAEHLLAVVDDVLDLSKIESGRMAVDRRDVDLEALLESVASVVEPAAEAKGVRIDLVVARGLPEVETDARHVRQILLNLAANAIKFTERGAVTLVAKEAGGPLPATVGASRAVAIAVEDTGIGVAPGDLDRIFEEFEQVRPAGRGDSQARGTGLGLAVARKLARLLGGDVVVESHVGTGSRFTLFLPLGDPAPTLPPSTRSQAPENARDAAADVPAGAPEEVSPRP